MKDSLDDNQYLIFLLDGEMFGLKILKIKEIIEHSDITRVPMMPKFIRGVINVRGNVVPVVDLNNRFYQKPTNIHRKTCIIIVEIDSDENKIDVGVLVDVVNEVIEIKDIDPAPSFGSKIKVDFVEGIGKIEDKFVIILNIDSVLNIQGIEDLVLDQTNLPLSTESSE
ncbi:MAG: purine-binding chemotaxis protein CheW [Leptospira sp.]|nr:purine-binding chemotaxis protein CheW [Leptospira sp.]